MNNNTDMFDEFLKIDNKDLQKILCFVKEEPIFFGFDKRLLSKPEIINYKNEFNINKDDIIPLVDLYDNEFLIYDIKINRFFIMDISDNFCRDIESIEIYINLLSDKEIK